MADKNLKNAAYGDNSIEVLEGPDQVRKKPAVIFGSDGLEGCAHSVFEILSNSVDEAREGYGNRIEVTVWRDHTVCIDDHGRGVPMDYNERIGKYNWELVYCVMYASGKYKNNASGSAYEYSLGLNGLGACATQFASEFMDVASYYNGKVYEMHFKRGVPTCDLMVREQVRGDRKSGTVTKWRPDLDVFTDIDIPRQWFENVIEKQAIVNAGVRFVLRFETESGQFDQTEYYFEHGVQDYVSAAVGEDALTLPHTVHLETMGRDREDKQDYKLKADVTFCFSNRRHFLEYYHNSSFLEHGGSPDKAVRAAFRDGIDKYLKTNGKYNKTESHITFADVEDCLVLVSNSFSTETSYANQTKKAITNTFIAKAMTDFLKEQLEIYFTENPLDADKICAQVLINKRSRETAESTRLNIKKKLTGTIDISNRVEKFINCRSKDAEKRELFIVEGDSAQTSCRLARSAEFQAIIPVRGKTLNCLKSSYEKIFKSDIITDLLRVIGCGVELQGKVKGDIPLFDLAQLKWSKIIICTDADEDGYQIRTLLLTMFYRLLPSLIEAGKIYIAESPLYEITCEGNISFAYNEQEKADILAANSGKKYSIQRSKGLGENEPEMMWKTTMNPASRRLIQVQQQDAELTAWIFETLLGDDLDGRKKFIAENGYEYVAEADI